MDNPLRHLARNIQSLANRHPDVYEIGKIKINEIMRFLLSDCPPRRAFRAKKRLFGNRAVSTPAIGVNTSRETGSSAMHSMSTTEVNASRTCAACPHWDLTYKTSMLSKRDIVIVISPLVVQKKRYRGTTTAVPRLAHAARCVCPPTPGILGNGVLSESDPHVSFAFARPRRYH
jgi:hypothetical protein